MKSKNAGALVALVLAGVICVFALGPTIGSATPTDSSALTEGGGEEASTLAEQGCPANNVCVYQYAFYEGVRLEYACSWSGLSSPSIYIRSARNRCGNKINYISNSGGSICMNPGGDRPNPGTYAVVSLPNNWAPPYC